MKKFFLKEFFDELNVNYSFQMTNKDFFHSNLSLYNLPSSKMYLEDDHIWNLNELTFPITINEKEEFFSNQINLEKV